MLPEDQIDAGNAQAAIHALTSSCLPTRPVEGAPAAVLELCASISLIDAAWLRPCRCEDDDCAISCGCGLEDIAETVIARIQCTTSRAIPATVGRDG
jgi:hypothetical protein